MTNVLPKERKGREDFKRLQIQQFSGSWFSVLVRASHSPFTPRISAVGTLNE